MNYEELIKTKIVKQKSHGFEPGKLSKHLWDWQKQIVQWAVRRGRCALFEDCGLGKTIQQIAWAEQVFLHTGQPVLILCPLAVAEQTVAEAEKFGWNIQHIRDASEVQPGINITNYEKLDRLEPGAFAGIVLDESSILKSFTGKLRRRITDAFSGTPYRLACSATPAPNDYTEFGQQAEFLGVMSAPEMLATWFINDTANTGTWRLKKHATQDFWRWVSTWAACLTKPSDIGYSDDGFILPELRWHHEVVRVDLSTEQEGELIRCAELSATNIHHEFRRTCKERCSRALEIVNQFQNEPVIIWCNTNYEADELKRVIPDTVEARGSDSEENKERKLNDFTTGKALRIITKPEIAGLGLNWQHCRVSVFVGLSYSFEQLYQAVKRTHRYGQTKPVECFVIQAETETSIMRVVKEKMRQHEEMLEQIQFAAQYLNQETQTVKMKQDIQTMRGRDWTMHNGDCVRVTQSMPPDSIDFSVFSPPFADLFVYSQDIQDMGNCASMDDFIEQFGYIVTELFRITAPGRLCAVHCCDLMSAKWKDGVIGLRNFSGEIIDAFRERDWIYHCRVTIWKDPVVEMQRTKALGLLHKQLLKDSAMSRVGSPEYLLLFRKPGDNSKPISHDKSDYPVELWQKDASPVWMDIDQGNVLNGSIAKEQNDERHICPLQLDVIRRALRLWSNPGDTVLSPFAGIGSEGYCAVEMGRRFIGIELKESYFNTACAFLKNIEQQPADLFELGA